MLVRPIAPADAMDWERMRQELWPCEPGEHSRDIAAFFGGCRRDPAEVLVAVNETGRLVGFAELSIRTYAEGCDTDRIGYLEGWFVEQSCRRQGVGGALVRAAEAWARAQGCAEFASDAELANEGSAAAHRALGFSEVERIVCFRKAL